MGLEELGTIQFEIVHYFHYFQSRKRSENHFYFNLKFDTTHYIFPSLCHIYNTMSAEEKSPKTEETTNANPGNNPSKKRRRRRRKKRSHSKSDDSDALPITSEGPADSKEEDVVSMTMEEIHALFLNDNTIADHLEALRTNRDKYLDQIRLFVRYSVIEQLTTSTKAKILCVLLIRNERDSAKWLLSLSQHFSVGEIARCIQLLDAPRKGIPS